MSSAATAQSIAAARRRFAPREVAVTPAAPLTLAEALMDAFDAHLAQHWRRLDAAHVAIDHRGLAVRFCRHDGTLAHADRLAQARPLLMAAAAAHEAGVDQPAALRESLLTLGVFVGSTKEAQEFAASLSRTGGSLDARNKVAAPAPLEP